MQMISHFHGSRFWNPFHFNVKKRLHHKRENPPPSHFFFSFCNKIKKEKSLNWVTAIKSIKWIFMFFISVYSSSFSALYGRRPLILYMEHTIQGPRHTHTHTIQTRNILHTHTERDGLCRSGYHQLSHHLWGEWDELPVFTGRLWLAVSSFLPSFHGFVCV